jgi:UDP-glucose 4-epimerase
MTLRGKRIIVTGSDGFVGSHLASRLEQEGAEVIPIDISQGIDITDWEQVKDYRNIDIIYHLAAKTYVPDTIEGPKETYFVNLVGTVNMLELAKLNKAENFVFASSYIYGNPQYLPIDEDHPINPTNPYSRSKALGEKLCHGYYEDYKLRCVIIRAFNLYGEGQRGDFLIPTILKQIEGREIKLNTPEPKRDFLYIKDAIEAYLRAEEYLGPGFEVFNIGSGVSYSVDEIAKKIVAISGRRIRIKYLDQPRKNEIMDTVANIAKAREKLGWEPRYDIDEGLRNTIQGTLISPLKR